MKTLIVVSAIAALAMTPSAEAGGFFGNRTNNVLSNITGIVAGVATRDVNVLNGTTVAVGNNSNILSGNGVLSGNDTLNGVGVLNNVLNGNGILGQGGQNRKRHGW